MNRDWDKVVMGVPYWKECLRVLKAGSFIFVMSAPRQDVLSRAIINLQDAGFYTGFTSLYWAYASGFPKASNIGKMVDKRLGKEPIKIKKKPYTNDRAIKSNNFAGGDYERIQCYETKPATDQAKALDGSYGGFQPKPAVEVILVAMKPLDCKTYVDQAMKNGKGITFLDDCRIPYESEGDKWDRKEQYTESADGYKRKNKSMYNQKSEAQSDIQGRFPANLISSDNVLDDGRVSSFGNSKEPYSYKGKEYKVDGFIKENSPEAPSNYGDTGSFNRYFCLDSWWSERIKKLPESVQKVFPFLIVPKAGKGEKDKGCDEFETKRPDTRTSSGMGTFEEKGVLPGKNCHATVKPIKLMSYLITLGSREGDIVLDPFAGSCTTAIAAKMLRREFIMVEKEKEYCEIGKARIDAVQEPML